MSVAFKVFKLAIVCLALAAGIYQGWRLTEAFFSPKISNTTITVAGITTTASLDIGSRPQICLRTKDLIFLVARIILPEDKTRLTTAEIKERTHSLSLRFIDSAVAFRGTYALDEKQKPQEMLDRFLPFSKERLRALRAADFMFSSSNGGYFEGLFMSEIRAETQECRRDELMSQDTKQIGYLLPCGIYASELTSMISKDAKGYWLDSPNQFELIIATIIPRTAEKENFVLKFEKMLPIRLPASSSIASSVIPMCQKQYLTNMPKSVSQTTDENHTWIDVKKPGLLGFNKVDFVKEY